MSETTLPPADRVVLISGAGRGIGRAVAQRLLADGYRMSFGVRDVAATRLAFAAADPARLHVARFDAHEPDSATRWIDEALGRFGRLDALVNNAGIMRQVDFANDGEAALDELWAVNVKAPYRLTRLALPHLRQSGSGRIVNVASTDGLRYRDASVSIGYAMTKHAVVALSHATRFAAWRDGVRVTALCPGAVETTLLDGLTGVAPACSRMQPEIVAHAVSFVLSLPNAASIAVLPINTRLEATL